MNDRGDLEKSSQPKTLSCGLLMPIKYELQRGELWKDSER